MQPPHDAAVRLPLAREVLCRVLPEPHAAADAPQVFWIVRHDVAAPQLEQLDAVLQRAEELVRLLHRGTVAAADIAALDQRVQRMHRGGAAQRHVGAAVHELQQLHRELHVTQATGAELELPVAVVRRDVLDDASTHRAYVRHEVLAGAGHPDHRREGVEIALRELLVARGIPGLEQCLELPGRGPSLVVRDMARQRAHERAGAAFGAEVGVDLPDRALAGVLAAQLHDGGGEAGRCADRRAVVGTLGRLVDEDDVDVAQVVELATAGLAHRHDREPAQLGSLVGRSGDLERGAERGHREVGQLRRGLLERGQGGQVARRDVQQLAEVRHAQLVCRRRLLHLPPAYVEGDRRGRQLARAEVDEVLGMTDEEVAEGLARAEHDQKSLTQLRVGCQQVEQLGSTEPLADRAERGERRVGARHAGDLVDEGVRHASEPRQVRDGTFAVAKSLAGKCQGELTRVSCHSMRLLAPRLAQCGWLGARRSGHTAPVAGV